MSLKAKINAAVDKAFSAVGDLAVTATLSSKDVSDYDFASRGTVSTSTTQTVQVIIEKTQKPSGEGFSTNALMKTGPDLSVYDTITVGTVVYNIVDYDDNGFTITAILVKEK